METPLFNKAWQESKVRIFRLEALPEYDVSEDREAFEKWKNGDNKFTEYEGWFNLLKAAAEKGMSVQRVRVVRSPSEYLKYEIDLWKVSRNFGEQAMFLEEEKYQKIFQEFGLESKDFWLFDDKLLIVFHYDQKGSLVEEELITDKGIVSKYLELKKKLIENSLSMTPFLYKAKRLRQLGNL